MPFTNYGQLWQIILGLIRNNQAEEKLLNIETECYFISHIVRSVRYWGLEQLFKIIS